jgi:hypothetical protein
MISSRQKVDSINEERSASQVQCETLLLTPNSSVLDLLLQPSSEDGLQRIRRTNIEDRS